MKKEESNNKGNIKAFTRQSTNRLSKKSIKLKDEFKSKSKNQRRKRSSNKPKNFKKENLEPNIDNVSHNVLLDYFSQAITPTETKRNDKNAFVADNSDIEKIEFLNFIHKFFEYLRKTSPNFSNQHNLRYALSFILALTEHRDLLEDAEVKEMLFSDHAIDTFFQVIINEYDFSTITVKLRSMSYQILTNLLAIDSQQAKEALSRWLSFPLNKTKYFDRV